ncbi:hypothetical protein GUJ93_ZPchr0002g26621 [Zizania palustris]|uniref:BURP domain-containing protein n=1 Tax=Zizania palustris TaxID=103762 RepID=A0A8J5S128_ZIZPA|nr:hypothetical protein GUJ93_ZPchr0002g26621 [Zizania palustris]
MACLLALAVVVAMPLMVQHGQLTFAHARTSPGEAFWRAALHGAAMPEAILELLPRENDVPSRGKASDGDDPAPNGANAIVDDDTSSSSPTVFFLEEAVRVGESLPLPRPDTTGTSVAAAAALPQPQQLYTVRSVGAAEGFRTDTSRWDPDHAAFRLLGVKPGGAAVCRAVPDAQILSAMNGKGSSLP